MYEQISINFLDKSVKLKVKTTNSFTKFIGLICRTRFCDNLIFKFKKDTSWIEEWKNFLGAINKKNNLIGDSEDGFRANRLVEAIYESSKSGSSVKIDRDVISKISS